MFSPATGDLMGVRQTPNSQYVEWNNGRVVASYVRKGLGISAHFASDKQGLRHIKSAINDFCEWIFNRYEWCTMILAIMNIESVIRIVKKCGFVPIGSNEDMAVYARLRNG